MPIRLVTFDVLHTLITPRLPIHIQYSLAFKPFLSSFSADAVKPGFMKALEELQHTKPAYEKGSRQWWSDVIYLTALSAGADREELKNSLPHIVNNLMHRFSSKEGYKAFHDAIPTLDKLHSRGVYTAIISNSDSRTKSVLEDLGFPRYLSPILLSEEEGIEKPSKAIFLRALERVNGTICPTEPPIKLNECLHVGDELRSDFEGAVDVGMHALLLTRPGGGELSGNHERGIHSISGLDELPTRVGL